MSFSAKALQYGYPVRGGATITPNDSTNFDTSRAILVDVAGNVKVTYVDGTEDTVALAASIWHPMCVNRIYSTGTTATGIHVGY